MSWTNLGVCGAWAGAEVEGLGGEAAMLEAHHVRPTWCPILHIAQVCLLIKLHVAATARQPRGSQRLVPWLDGTAWETVLWAMPFISVCIIQCPEPGKSKYWLINLTGPNVKQTKTQYIYIKQMLMVETKTIYPVWEPVLDKTLSLLV